MEESLALEGRARYYDRAGALRDVLQNHACRYWESSRWKNRRVVAPVLQARERGLVPLQDYVAGSDGPPDLSA